MLGGLHAKERLCRLLFICLTASLSLYVCLSVAGTVSVVLSASDSLCQLCYCRCVILRIRVAVHSVHTHINSMPIVTWIYADPRTNNITHTYIHLVLYTQISSK